MTDADCQRAISEADARIANGDRSADPYLQRGAAFKGLGRHADALSDLDLAAIISPNDASVRTTRAEVLLQLTRWRAAVDDLDVAIRADPTCWKAWTLRGVANSELELWADSESDCSWAITQDHDNAVAWRTRGRSRYRLGKLADSLDDFRRALALAPGDAECLYWSGLALRDLGNHQQAAAAFTAAIGLNARYTEAYVARGKSYAALGDTATARSDWAIAAQMLHQSH